MTRAPQLLRHRPTASGSAAPAPPVHYSLPPARGGPLFDRRHDGGCIFDRRHGVHFQAALTPTAIRVPATIRRLAAVAADSRRRTAGWEMASRLLRVGRPRHAIRACVHVTIRALAGPDCPVGATRPGNRSRRPVSAPDRRSHASALFSRRGRRVDTPLARGAVRPTVTMTAASRDERMRRDHDRGHYFAVAKLGVIARTMVARRA
jgi:hypothetical protein